MLAIGCAWTFMDLWAPRQCAGHHQCLLPSHFPEEDTDSLKLVGRTSAAMEAFLLQRLPSSQRLGNSPSAGLPAAPSPTQRARGQPHRWLCAECAC